MEMKYPYGYCGMPCALCSRNRTEGKSRCEGCSFGGYYTDVCKVNHCCVEKKLNHCRSCDVFPCARLGKMGDFSDLNTNHVKQRTAEYIGENGFDKWYEEYCSRADMLTVALEKYNDGRMKRYLCELFITANIASLREIMRQAEEQSKSTDCRGKPFKTIVSTVLNKE